MSACDAEHSASDGQLNFVNTKMSCFMLTKVIYLLYFFLCWFFLLRYRPFSWSPIILYVVCIIVIASKFLIFYYNHDLPCVLIQLFLSYRALSILSPRDWVRSTTAKALMFKLEYMILWFVTCCILLSLCTHLMLMGSGGGEWHYTVIWTSSFLLLATMQGQDLDPSNFRTWYPHPSSTCMKRLWQFLNYT